MTPSNAEYPEGRERERPENFEKMRRYAWRQVHQALRAIERIPERERGNLEDVSMVLEKYAR